MILKFHTFLLELTTLNLEVQSLSGNMKPETRRLEFHSNSVFQARDILKDLGAEPVHTSHPNPSLLNSVLFPEENHHCFPPTCQFDCVLSATSRNPPPPPEGKMVGAVWVVVVARGARGENEVNFGELPSSKQSMGSQPLSSPMSVSPKLPKALIPSDMMEPSVVALLRGITYFYTTRKLRNNQFTGRLRGFHEPILVCHI